MIWQNSWGKTYFGLNLNFKLRPLTFDDMNLCNWILIYREELPQVYSSRAGLIGYIFASWMREEMGLHREITKHNEKVENIMVQLQKDHQSGKLRTTVASNTRQSSRELRENEVEFLRADKKYKDMKRSTRSQSIPTNQNHGNHHSGSPSPTSSRENLKPPTRTTSTPQVNRPLGDIITKGTSRICSISNTFSIYSYHNCPYYTSIDHMTWSIWPIWYGPYHMIKILNATSAAQGNDGIWRIWKFTWIAKVIYHDIWINLQKLNIIYKLNNIIFIVI